MKDKIKPGKIKLRWAHKSSTPCIGKTLPSWAWCAPRSTTTGATKTSAAPSTCWKKQPRDPSPAIVPDSLWKPQEKPTKLGTSRRARGFAAKLLAAEPFNAEYVSAMAAIYARQGDDAGLRTFYTTKIQDLARAPIPASQRIEEIAELRRALIPVLIRTRDFTGALDQYIEVLNRFPEDADLTREVATFARNNGVIARLHDYYAKTGTDSPKDFRWPMVLARIEVQMEDYPAAIDSYTRASAVRPDRVDLLTERLNLEQRLMRFDDAATTSAKLYELTYHNPQWMETLAEIRARQGQTAAAVAALNTAWVDGRPNSAQNYFNVAERSGILEHADGSAPGS